MAWHDKERRQKRRVDVGDSQENGGTQDQLRNNTATIATYPPPTNTLSLTKYTRKITTNKPHFEFGFAGRGEGGRGQEMPFSFFLSFFSSVEHDTRTSHHTQHPWRRRKGENPHILLLYHCFPPTTMVLRPPFNMPS